MKIKECEKQTLKAAAYIRVSTGSYDQENSFEVQQRYFEELLTHNEHYENAGIYADFGLSGTSIENREGLQSLLFDCEKGMINRIICKSLSRFARNVSEFLQIIAFLNKNGVTVFFEKENLDTANALNDIVTTVLAAIAEEESLSISENMRLANTNRYIAGEVPNEVIYGYRWSENNTLMISGYKYRNIEVIPEESEIVKRIFEDVSNGKRYIDIARTLNAEKITPPLKSNSNIPCKRWKGRHIYNIISNERYTGCVRTQKTYTHNPLTHSVKINRGEIDRHLITKHHPAIISKEMFNSVQTILKKNSNIYGNNKSGKKRVQILTGLLICPKCGHNLNCNGRNKKPYWFCPEDECTIQIYEAIIFRMLKKAIKIRFKDGEILKKNIQKMYETTDNLYSLKTQINNDRIAAKNRVSILENQVSVLENKLLDIKDTKTKKIILKNIAALENKLVSEKENISILEKKSEKCKFFSSQGLHLLDMQKAVLAELENNDDFDKITENILHNIIRGIISKAIIHSPTELSVYWLDNSVTKVCGGYYHA